MTGTKRKFTANLNLRSIAEGDGVQSCDWILALINKNVLEPIATKRNLALALEATKRGAFSVSVPT